MLHISILHMTSHNRKSTGASNNINDGSVIVKWQGASIHNIGTLKLKQLSGMSSLLVIHTWVKIYDYNSNWMYFYCVPIVHIKSVSFHTK